MVKKIWTQTRTKIFFRNEADPSQKHLDFFHGSHVPEKLGDLTGAASLKSDEFCGADRSATRIYDCGIASALNIDLALFIERSRVLYMDKTRVKNT